MVEVLIRKWVPLINARFGRSEFDEQVVKWFTELKDRLIIRECPDFYIAGFVSNDMYGDISFVVLSCGCSDNAGIKTFLQMQDEINSTAKALGCRFVAQGGILDERYNKYLIRAGYAPTVFKKEVERWGQN